MASLQVRALSVGYGPVRALRDVSLDVPAGAVVVVLGGNGAGKTTLLRAVSQTLAFHRGAATQGSVSFDGRPLDGLGPARAVAAGVVQVPEGRQVFARMTVADNLRAARSAPAPDPARTPHARWPASTSCSRSWPRAPGSGPACSPAASSRCWPSAGP